MNTDTDTRWFELLTDAVAHYVDDSTSEVYAMRADAPRFARIREDEGTTCITTLTNDKAELICGEARVSHVSQDVIAGLIEGMLA